MREAPKRSSRVGTKLMLAKPRARPVRPRGRRRPMRARGEFGLVKEVMARAWGN